MQLLLAMHGLLPLLLQLLIVALQQIVVGLQPAMGQLEGIVRALGGYDRNWFESQSHGANFCPQQSVSVLVASLR